MHNRPWYDQLREHEPLTQTPIGAYCAACHQSPCSCVPEHYLRLRAEEPFPSDPSTPRGSTEERAFVFAIGASIVDLTTRLVFADWLDEHGRTDEGATLRDPWASPVITPFRVLPYWRKAAFFARLRCAHPTDPDAAILVRRLKIHDQIHGGHFRAKVRAHSPRILLLDDKEAVLAGMARWPLLTGEPEPILQLVTHL